MSIDSLVHIFYNAQYRPVFTARFSGKVRRAQRPESPKAIVNDNQYIPKKVLRLNVGYLLAEGPGRNRVNELDIPSTIRVAEDLTLDFLRGTVAMSRTSRGILVQATLETRLLAECDRCLADAPVPLAIPIEEMYVYPPEPGAEFSIDDSGIMDLAPLIREEVLLALPKHLLCEPECKGLCKECGANLNDGPCECDAEPIDPRFAALKAFRDQLNSQETHAQRKN